MGYTIEETIRDLKKELSKPEKLYKASCIDRSGTVKDGKDYYSEIISRELLEKINEFDRIEEKPRLDYKVSSHEDKARRGEEHFAKSLVGTKIDSLGKIIDFQLPLKISKNRENAGVGKIDLIADNDSNIYIIELKYASNAETLLRAVLEIETYYRLLHKRSFVQYIHSVTKIDRNEKDIRKAVLLTKDTRAYKEAKELESRDPDKRPKLRELIRKLNISIFLLDLNTKVIFP